MDRIQKTYYVLVYSNRESAYASPNEVGLLCGIDESSGGYPYGTDKLGSAYIWDNMSAPKRYIEQFPFLDLAILNVRLEISD
jgi:hypothetical protein